MVHKLTVEFQVDIVVEPDDGEFCAHCPALQGLHVSGASEEEAVQNATDAAIAYLESLIKHGEPIPISTTAETAAAPETPGRRTHSQKLEVAVA